MSKLTSKNPKLIALLAKMTDSQRARVIAKIKKMKAGPKKKPERRLFVPYTPKEAESAWKTEVSSQFLEQNDLL